MLLLTLLTMMGRAAFVFPFSLLHNCWAREKLTVKEMVVIWYSPSFFFFLFFFFIPQRKYAPTCFWFTAAPQFAAVLTRPWPAI